MNLIEIYVSNITKHEIEKCQYDGGNYIIHHLVADRDCYGDIECQKEFDLTDGEYQHVMRNGYYLG